MASTATVTGKVGPGLTMTSQVFNNVNRFEFDCDNTKLTIVNNGNTISIIDINAASTITCTVSAGAYTLTVS